MPMMTFQWNVPFEMDPDENECTIKFHYNPGSMTMSGLSSSSAGDYDLDERDPEIEDITMTVEETVWDYEELDDRCKDEILEACWVHVEGSDPDGNDDEGDRDE